MSLFVDLSGFVAIISVSLLIVFMLYFAATRILERRRSQDETKWLELGAMTKRFSISTKWKRIFAILLIGILMTSFSIYTWGRYHPGSYSDGVRNEDIRVFTESKFDAETNTSYSKGSHDIFIDSRFCEVVGPYIEVIPNESCQLEVFLNYTYDYKLSVGFFGGTIFCPCAILYNMYGNPPDTLQITFICIAENSSSGTVSGVLNGTFSNYLQSDDPFHFGAGMFVRLDGISSTEGTQEGTPASLVIHELSYRFV